MYKNSIMKILSITNVSNRKRASNALQTIILYPDKDELNIYKDLCTILALDKMFLIQRYIQIIVLARLQNQTVSGEMNDGDVLLVQSAVGSTTRLPLIIQTHFTAHSHILF